MIFRVIAAIIVVTSVDYHALFPQSGAVILALSILAAAIYSVITYLLGLSKKDEQPNTQLQESLSYADALLLGIIVMWIPFSIVTLATITILVAIRATALGGIPRLFGHTALFATGASLTVLAGQPDIRIQPTAPMSVAIVICLPFFLCFLGWQLHQRQKLLTESLKTTQRDNLQLKLNNYKLAKYLSPSLRKAILSGKRVTLETQRKKLSVFFSDIKGFSELSEELETESLTEMLNLYLTEMSDIALKFGGTVDKFIGDAIMVFFGDPISRGVKDDCIACVSMAIAMQKRMNDLNQRWAAQGIKKPLQVRMGINTGFCTVGNFGTENRLDYTLLGTEVNKASRLESAAQSGEILISRPTYELVKDVIYCESRGTVRLKGFADPVEVYNAIDLRANLGNEGHCIEKITDGFSIYLDLEHIPHLQKQRVMASLEEAYDQLRIDIAKNTKDGIKIVK